MHRAGAAPPRFAAILGELFRLNAPVGEGGLRVTALLRQTRCRLALRLLLRRAGGEDTAVLLTADDVDDAGARHDAFLSAIWWTRCVGCHAAAYTVEARVSTYDHRKTAVRLTRKVMASLQAYGQPWRHRRRPRRCALTQRTSVRWGACAT